MPVACLLAEPPSALNNRQAVAAAVSGAPAALPLGCVKYAGGIFVSWLPLRPAPLRSPSCSQHATGMLTRRGATPSKYSAGIMG